MGKFIISLFFLVPFAGLIIAVWTRDPHWLWLLTPMIFWITISIGEDDDEDKEDTYHGPG